MQIKPVDIVQGQHSVVLLVRTELVGRFIDFSHELI